VLDLSVCVACAATAVVFMGSAWVLSLRLRDASIADVVWGPMLAAIAVLAYLIGERPERSLLLAVLVGLWGIRLAAHIGARNLGHGEDRRYAAFRERDGASFRMRSLWSIFGIQAGLGWIVALPVQSAAADATPQGIWAVALGGALVALIGLAYETAADLQLRRFLVRGASGVMDQGLWRFSRHPNYFGDAVFWWGVWLVALEAGSPVWTAVGPLVMTVILLKVSGVSLLEQTISDRRPAYREYAQRTNAFIPGRSRS